MNTASARGIRAGCIAVATLILAACATKSPSTPQMPTPPTPPPSSPSSAPKPSSPGSPSSPSSSESRSESSSSSTSSAGKGAPSPAQKQAGTGAPPASSGSPSSKAGGTQPAAGGAKSSGGGSAGKTEAEQNAEWDEAFYGSLGEFDKRLSKEQASIEKRRGEIATAGGGRGTESGDGGAGGGGISGQVPSEVSTSESGGAPASGGTSESSALGGSGSAGSSGPKFPPPEGTPDGKDDDVVARQLREAAETEKDPELRTRLWEEYRKYKSRKS